ncbi:tRNA-splicing ligase RtcB-domain-containing protein [Tuber borchii]|uniref:3'-phosphate/5'-hydroxy nucleic acid ligase n=1 Tax=Tuber borchii TaxID=42251 RepID=A0A2T7A850_TUBBO|nr:tRNA-splicing ligase RtcB-domain-containing protein [Tuber borchii]
MPSTRIVLKLNSNQSISAPYLLPQTVNPRAQVLSCAKSKFRIKATRIFLPGGQELLTSQAVQDVLNLSHEHRTVGPTFLISAGEPYVGALAPPPSAHAETRTCEVHVIAEDSYVDPQAITQLETAAKLPGMVRAVGLPDLHPGGKFPIGAAFVSDRYIYPSLVGSDIGCGMTLFMTGLTRKKLEDQNGIKRVAESLRGLETAWRSPQERAAWLGDCAAGDEWDKSVGTVGGGNHFAELQILEQMEEGHGLCSGIVVLLVHSGSRRFGKHILETFTKDDKSISLAYGDPKTSEYLKLHNQACNWASKSRDLIALRIFECIEGSRWILPETIDLDTAAHLNTRLQGRRVLDVLHNTVTPTPWPPHAEVQHQKSMFIHRKGAAPAPQGTPFLPLPGSRGTPTLLIKPLFSELNQNGFDNGLSLAHGAGRTLSRTEARGLSRKYNNDVKVLTEMKPMGMRNGGKGRVVTSGYVICDEKELVWEEAVEAYKDVEAVAHDLEKCGAAKIIGKCIPKVTYKVRNESLS